MSNSSEEADKRWLPRTQRSGRRCCASRFMLALAATLSSPTIASAEHHLLKRALQEANCLPASVEELSRSGENLVFEARCKGSTNRRLTLLCTPARCAVDDHGRHAPEEDEDRP